MWKLTQKRFIPKRKLGSRNGSIWRVWTAKRHKPYITLTFLTSTATRFNRFLWATRDSRRWLLYIFVCIRFQSQNYLYRSFSRAPSPSQRRSKPCRKGEFSLSLSRVSDSISFPPIQFCSFNVSNFNQFTDASYSSSSPSSFAPLRISCFCLLYFVTEMIPSFIPVSRMGLDELSKHTSWYFCYMAMWYYVLDKFAEFIIRGIELFLFYELFV